ncbi:unnamed protein product, partial [Larinioides sclopetarius]
LVAESEYLQYPCPSHTTYLSVLKPPIKRYRKKNGNFEDGVLLCLLYPASCHSATDEGCQRERHALPETIHDAAESTDECLEQNLSPRKFQCATNGAPSKRGRKNVLEMLLQCCFLLSTKMKCTLNNTVWIYRIVNFVETYQFVKKSIFEMELLFQSMLNSMSL